MSIDKDLDAYKLADLQRLRSTIKIINRGEYFLNDVIDYIEERLRNTRIKRPECPQCGYPMIVYPVNISKCTQVGGGYITQSVCFNCDYEEYK